MSNAPERGWNGRPAQPVRRTRREPPVPHKPSPVAARQTVVKAPHGDIATSGSGYGLARARRAERSAPVKRAQRAVYDSLTPAQKQAIIRNATGSVKANLAPIHAGRVARARDIARAQATKDTKGGSDRARAAAYLAAHPEVLHPGHPAHGSALASIIAAAKLGPAVVKGASDLAAKAAPYAVAGYAPALSLTANVLGKGKELNRLASNAGRDLVDIPANAIPSLYKLGETAIHDPKKAAGMVAQPYIDVAKHPVRSFEDHPLGTALLFSGLKGGSGRAAGQALRTIPSNATRRAGSTARSARRVEGTALEQRRAYSPDVINKAVQVAVERNRQRRAAKVDTKAAAATGERAVELQTKAVKLRGTQMSENQIRRRVDEHQDLTETLRRSDRGRAVGAAQQAIPRSVRKAGPAAVLVAQRIIKPNDADLHAYRNELVASQPSLSHAKLGASKTLVAHIDKALTRGVDWQAVSKAADDYRATQVPGQKALGDAGLLDSGQVERRTLLPYAVRNMGAKSDGERIVAQDGSPLTNDAIRAHMQVNGVPEAAYVTQAPNRRGARNFFRSSDEPAKAGAAKYTGKATTEGTFDAHPDVLVEGAANTQALVSQQEHFGKFVTDFGRRDGKGELKTYATFRQAQQAANNMLHQADGSPRAGALKFRPVRVNPFAGRKDQLEQLVNDANVDHTAHNSVHDALHDALSGNPGEGPWALIPEAAADRQIQHLKVLGGGGLGKTFQVGSSAFRRTVLATSPRWLYGNLLEGLGRAAVAHAGPRAYVTGSRVMKRLGELDPKAAQELQARALGGGNLKMAERQQIHRGAEQFAQTPLAPIAHALGTFWRTPGPKQVAGVWNKWTDFVFNTVNGRAESAIQKAMLGQAVRKSPLMEESMVKLGQKAVDQAARGLRNTNEQVRFARQVDDMYGKYGKMSPGLRRSISTLTPFAAWAMSAVKFTYLVLPRDHPVLTSLLASSNQATEEWRKQHGLEMFAAGAVPGFLQGSIPVGGGGKIRASRYSPTSIAGSPTDSLAGLLLPQVSGVQEALQGRDWKGAKLRGKNGQDANDVDKLLAAGGAFLTSTVPLLAQGQRIKAKGSLGAGAKAEVDPFPAIRPKGAVDGGGSAVSSGPVDPTLAIRHQVQAAQREATRGLAEDPEILRIRREIAAAARP
jgi:hypothetical protein